MAGNQSRGLIIASRTRGWNPTEIPGMGSLLPNWDKDQGNFKGPGDPCVGRLTDGTPDGWPDGHDVLGVPSPAPQSQDFSPQPQASGNENRRTSGADPYKGFGEGGY